MKHLLLKHVTTAVLFCFAVTSHAFSSGSGTEKDPYIITSASDLAKIPSNSTEYYQLASDITNYIPSKGSNFSGHLDGAGHYISFNISGEYSLDDYGLFAKCSGATIENLTLKGSISFTQNYTHYYPETFTYNTWVGGGIMSCAENYYDTEIRLGGVCGSATSTTFRNVHNEASLTMSIASGIIGNTRKDYIYGNDSGIGGLVGKATSCKFDQCSNVGTISGSYGSIGRFWPSKAEDNNGAGGIIGIDTNSSISNCYVKCSVRMANPFSEFYAALVGLSSSSQISNCYCEENTRNVFTWCKDYPSTIIDCIGKGSFSWNLQPVCSNCYVANTSELIDNLDGITYVDRELFSVQQWYTENIPSWDFNSIWYMPSGENALPLFRIEPNIEWTGTPTYGDYVEFKSSNPYSNIDIESSIEGAIVVNASKITFLKAGSIPITISQNSVDQYKPVKHTIFFDVKKAPLTISANDLTMTYGEMPSAEDILRYDGFVGLDTPESLEKQPTVTFGGSPTSNVGKYNIAVYGASSDNYIISYNKGIQTITPRPIVVKPHNITRVYGSTNPTLKISYEGWVNGDNESMITEYPIASTQADALSHAGNYTIVARGGNIHPNYTFTYNTGTLCIEKAILKIGVQDVRRPMNEFNPEFTLTFQGFKNNDDINSLDLLPTASCEASYNSPEGVYPIVLEGGADKNYTYNLTNGTLVVESMSEIIGVHSDINDEHARYFTIDGQEVILSDNQKLIPGIYIRVSKSKTTKIIIK